MSTKRQRAIAKRLKRKSARDRRKSRERRELNASIRRERAGRGGDITFEQFAADMDTQRFAGHQP